MKRASLQDTILKTRPDLLGRRILMQANLGISKIVVESQEVLNFRLSGQRERLSRARYPLAREIKSGRVQRISDVLGEYYVGVDLANGDDHTAYTIAVTPSRLRKFLRRIRVDRSKWNMKIIKQGVFDANKN